MGDEVVVALIALGSVVLGGVVTHTLPKWIEARKSPSLKEAAEADGIKWQNLVNEIRRLEAKVSAHETRIDVLERERTEAMQTAAAYHLLLVQHNIEPPEETRGWLAKAFPVPGVKQ